MKKLLPLAIVVILVGVVGVFLIGRHRTSATDAGQELTEVTVRLDWTPGSEHSFLYLAKERGLFEKAGLDLAIQGGDGSTTAAKLVANGSVDYALCSGDTALIAASAGAPVRVLAVLYSRSPTVIYSRKDRNISTPKDLEGRKYSAYMKSTTYKQFLAFCKVAEVDVSKVDVVSTGGKAEDILTDAVDASGGYTYIQPVQCELAGIPVNEMFVADYGVNSYSMSIIGPRTDERTDVTRRLVQVALAAYEVMLSDSNAALEAHSRAVPTANMDFESKKLERLTAFIKKNLETQGQLGMQTTDGWTQTQEFLFSQGLVTTNIALAGFFTTEYLP